MKSEPKIIELSLLDGTTFCVGEDCTGIEHYGSEFIVVNNKIVIRKIESRDVASIKTVEGNIISREIDEAMKLGDWAWAHFIYDTLPRVDRVEIVEIVRREYFNKYNQKLRELSYTVKYKEHSWTTTSSKLFTSKEGLLRAL